MSHARWSLLVLGLPLIACEATTKGSLIDQCPNWNEAMRRAERLAGCDAHHRGDPNNRCQAALKQCMGGCDICQFLGSGNRFESDAFIAEKDEPQWGLVTRVPIDREHLNGYGGGKRGAVEVGLFSRRFKFNWHLCNDSSFVDVLASTIDHEATHACIEVNPPGILDKGFFPPPDCSAEELENICVGK